MESVTRLISVSLESGLLRAVVMKHTVAGYYINMILFYKVQIRLY